MTMENNSWNKLYLINKIVLLHNNLKASGLVMRYLWVPSHCGVTGYEYVDYLVNLSSNFIFSENQNDETQMKLCNSKISTVDAIRIANQICLKMWNRSYVNSSNGDHYKAFFPSLQNLTTRNDVTSGLLFR